MKLLYKLFKFSIRRRKKIIITVYRHHHCSYSILRHHNMAYLTYLLWYTTRPVFISKRSIAVSNSVSMIHNKLITTTTTILVQRSYVIYNIIIIYE